MLLALMDPRALIAIQVIMALTVILALLDTKPMQEFVLPAPTSILDV